MGKAICKASRGGEAELMRIRYFPNTDKLLCTRGFWRIEFNEHNKSG